MHILASRSGIFLEYGYNNSELCLTKYSNHGADVNLPDKDGRNPIRVAASEGHVEIVKLLNEHEATRRRITH